MTTNDGMAVNIEAGPTPEPAIKLPVRVEYFGLALRGIGAQYPGFVDAYGVPWSLKDIVAALNAGQWRTMNSAPPYDNQPKLVGWWGQFGDWVQFTAHYTNGAWYHDGMIVKPTHWRPLPVPPPKEPTNV